MKQAPPSSSYKELVFVYNARSGLFNRAVDFAHKIISPATYSCSLCKLTHGFIGKHQEWENFIKQLPFPVTFLYKDQTDSKEEVPHVYLMEGGQKRILLKATELHQLPSLSALIKVIQQRIE
ncbi:MAG TPA: hypothetical protein VK014_05175 [Cyclobacteriaceae bacterium]|nr:hypothetical protein [Cyclobacteriaceae bacterium]